MKNDTDTIEINLAKTNASSEKYFALFDKYIPTNVYTEDNNVLLYDICNEGCIELIVQKNPDATYFIYDNLENTDVAGLCDTLPELMPNTKFVFIDNKYDNVDLDKQFEYNLSGMKFDCIIMNPPYQRNLHLKILEKAIEHLKDDDSICICLHPNYLAEKLYFVKNKPFNTFQPIFENTLLDAEIVNSNNVFDAAFEKDLIISTYKTNIDKSKKFDYYKFINICPIFDKTIKLVIDKKISVLSECYDTTKPFKLVFPAIHGHIGNADMYELTSKKYEKALVVKPCTSNKTYEKKVVSFDTENERKNFYNSINTTFFKYWVSYVKISKNFNYDGYLPFMDDYTEPWTDERFYSFFNITSDEQKIIEETMEKYK